MSVGKNSARAHQMRYLASQAQAHPVGLVAPREIKHGVNAYRSKKCDCDFCKASQAAAALNYKALRAEGVDTTSEPRGVRVAVARRLLEDGATYAEAAATAATDEKNLALEYPGFEENAVEFNSVMAGIKNDEHLLRMHREIWQGAEYASSY